jgi:shikimate kinase
LSHVKTDMVVTLIGYRGTGKSAVARPLAARLGLEAIDADTEIERRAQRTIREIFADEGEPAFRAREREVMCELLGRDGLVIAAGGGAVLDPSTRQLMRTTGLVVWLRASADTIEARVAADIATRDRRPNLTSFGGRREIEELLAVREPLYRECATVTVDIDGRSIEQVVERILAALPPVDPGGREP